MKGEKFGVAGRFEVFGVHVGGKLTKLVFGKLNVVG
jgi:hypothetical protein